ncbi:MAG: glycosyl transferase, partial [Parasporobacterium sp.]|nr:glycosyl transferase [Parasporobacterium sp.]
MSFTSVRARTQVLTADGLLRLRFPQLCGRLIDAEYLKADQSAAFGFAGGLPFYAPICSHLLNEREVDAFIHDIKGSLLVIMEDGKLSLFTENGEVGIPKAVEDTIFQVYDKICASPGTLNEKGELVLDLKAYPVGPHYPVNLLLGNREGYPMPLVTTPKSALDALGRGSFRGAGAQQILATRYVLRPEENGEPANRQFYLVEDGKQIFYSADVNTNVVSAVCTHSQNRTIISYETACGLSVERTIFILPQENGMPDAVEVQRVRISNRTEKTRELKIIFTGMFGITAPDALVNDIVYANIVAESEVFYKADAAAALTIYNQPAYNRREKRFALLLSEGSFMDEFCTSASDFIGTGTLEKPELAVKLPNRFSRKNAPFFAMAKNITLHPEDTKYADSFTGMMETKEMTEDSFAAALERLIDKYSEEKALEDILKKLKDFWDYYPSYIRPKTGNARFDAYVGHNLPFQTLYQTYVSRAFAWTQKAYREIGFREIQDIYASMYYLDAMGKDDLVKELLSNWIRNVFPMGYANHNFVVAGKEPGVCSDDALWLVQAVDRYVRLSGDLGILLEEFDVAGRDPEKNGKRTLAETIENILLYSGVISTGVHGLPLLDHADWNDTLRLDPQVYDGPAKEKAYFAQLEEAGGKYGDPFRNTLSESVMNACLAKIAADAAAGMAKAACEGGMADLGRELT